MIMYWIHLISEYVALQDLAFRPTVICFGNLWHCFEREVVLRAYQVWHGFKSIVCGPAASSRQYGEMVSGSKIQHVAVARTLTWYSYL